MNDGSKREMLLDQISSVGTSEELQEARLALRRWIFAHPDDLGLADAGESLYVLEDGARRMAAEELAMTQEEREEKHTRQEIIHQVCSPASLAEVEEVRQSLDQWFREHPTDEEMHDLLTPLAVFHEAYAILAEADSPTQLAIAR